jgi:hypothetical protein
VRKEKPVMPRDLRLYSLLLLTACANVDEGPSQAPVVSESESAVLMHCPPREAPACERKKGRLVCVCEPIDTMPPECTVSAAPLPALGGGYYHSCEVAGGAMKCWGFVPGSTGTAGTATFVLANVASGLAGGTHDCAVSTSGSVACWGGTVHGELGDGTNIAHDTPTPVVGISDAVSGDAGYGLSCVVRATGEVACWGGNALGQIGDGSLVDRWTPSTVSGLSGVTAVTTSESGQFACALKNDGSVWCWGTNDLGQLGSGTSGGVSALPVRVAGLASAVSISAGSAHACAVDCYGQVSCWGYNGNGRLGDGTTGSRPYPAVISGLSATQVSARRCHVRAADRR